VAGGAARTILTLTLTLTLPRRDYETADRIRNDLRGRGIEVAEVWPWLELLD